MTITQRIFSSLDNWMATSQDNYGMYFIIFGTILAISFIALAILYKKIGGKDERTNAIRLRINYCFFVAAFIAMALYVNSVDSTTQYISQLSLVPLTIATVASTVAASMYYLKNR